MKKLLSTIFFTTVNASVFAAGAFDGPYAELAIGGVSTSSKNSYSNAYANGGTTTSGDFFGKVLAGYSQSLDKFNLAANIFYVIGNQGAGTQSQSTNLPRVSYSYNNQIELKNTWGLSVEPGYYVTDKTLGYLKFSWFNSSLNSTLSGSASGIVNGSTSLSSSGNANGAGFGIGAKQLFTNNIYGFVEYQYVTYGSVTLNGTGILGNGSHTAKPYQNYGLVGVGYKF